MKIISLGWGVQSFTLAAMAALGETEPVDAAIHADTTHEASGTYEFARQWTPWLEEHDVKVVTVQAPDAEPVNRFGGCMVPAFIDGHGIFSRRSRGYSPTNYAWLLEWVPNGIPAAYSGKPNGKATPNGLPSPEMLWGTVQAEIDRVHYSGIPELPAPILTAIEAVGGWYVVCKANPDGNIPSRLRDAYRSVIGG